MSATENWPIEWISQEKVEAITLQSFSKALQKITGEQKKNLQTDPTLAIALSTFLDLPEKMVARIADDVSIVKTLQNAIGSFHQSILGNAVGWNDLGPRGGVFDIYSDDKIALAGNRKVVAEVKMRYNTMNASQQRSVWDDLKTAVKSRGGESKCVAYLIQIVPNKQESYDKPWTIADRGEVPYVRCIDGTTAYHLVTGDPDALNQLLHALPPVFRKVLNEVGAHKTDQTNLITDVYIDQSIRKSLPTQSALVEDSR